MPPDPNEPHIDPRPTKYDPQTTGTPPQAVPQPMPAPVPPPAAPPAASPGWWSRLSPGVRHLVSGGAAVVLAVLFAWLKSQGVPVPSVPLVIPTEKQAPAEPTVPPVGAMGWQADPDLIREAKVAVKTVFRASPAGESEQLPAAVYQWQVHKKVTGEPAPEKNQNPIGSCVGFGSTTAYERALVCAIAAGEPFEFTRFSEEATYAISRVTVGKGQLRGQDGSVGGWAATGLTDDGALPAKKYPAGDFTHYNPTRCRQLGDAGLPKALVDECANFKAGSAAQLKTWTEAKQALAAGHGVFTCSMQGFAGQRDANGVCQPSGRWGHCMCLDGYHTDAATGREYGHFDNSWDGVYHKGPVGWGSPTGTGFWADARVIAQMIAEGDSWAVSKVKGFPKQHVPLDWFTDNRAPQLRQQPLFAQLFALTPVSGGFLP